MLEHTNQRFGYPLSMRIFFHISWLKLEKEGFLLKVPIIIDQVVKIDQKVQFFIADCLQTWYKER